MSELLVRLAGIGIALVMIFVALYALVKHEPRRLIRYSHPCIYCQSVRGEEPTQTPYRDREGDPMCQKCNDELSSAYFPNVRL